MSGSVQRLNLGCGTSAAPEWVNVDGSWSAWLSRHRRVRGLLTRTGVLPEAVATTDWPENVIVHDLRRSLPFGSGSFDAIYASHVLEHLYWTDARRLLVECHRVLRPSGILRVVVPDLRAIVDEYVERSGCTRLDSPNDADGDPCMRMNRRLMFRQDHPPDGPLHLRVYALLADFHSHKWIYDAPHLTRLFRDVGFQNASVRAYCDSAIPGISGVERPDRVLNGEGICVEGIRST